MKMQTEKLKDLLTKITQGEWITYPRIKEDSNMCAVPYLEVSSKDSFFWVAQINASEKVFEVSQFNANAELISLTPQLAKRVIELEEAVNNLLDLIENIDFRSKYDPYDAQTKAKQLLK